MLNVPLLPLTIFQLTVKKGSSFNFPCLGSELEALDCTVTYYYGNNTFDNNTTINWVRSEQEALQTNFEMTA